mmetsp:Transcript_22111/g.50586  ORF Transcript_22111/g.50586 Transcript_22111/m.50586 type:complete len:660 (+) Transcript_22111:58-2037(+)
MGFQEELAQAPPKYRDYFMNYARLKEAIETLPASFGVASTRADEIKDILTSELRKVNHFACMKHEAIFLDLRSVCEDINSKMEQAWDAEIGAQVIIELKERIEALGSEIVNLDFFVRLNYKGFTTVTRKLDAVSGMASNQLFLAKLQQEPFCTVRFDDILILLGLAWMRWRTLLTRGSEQSADATWKPPESFVRNTAKYWVRPEKVTLLKTRILPHMPYLLFNASVRDQERLLDPYALLELDNKLADASTASQAMNGTMEESQLLSSIYFDSLDGSCYQDRILRKEGARLVRFRWYGENTGDPNTEVYVERKVHHEGWTKDSSSKDRCVVPQSDIYKFMKCDFDIEAYFKSVAAKGVSPKAVKAMKGIAEEVTKLIEERQLQPMIRTSYYRSAFQLATDNKVRISLDTQMTLLNEFQGAGHPVQNWCHVPSDKLSEEDVNRFPYAILEIKLQNVAENPPWLQQLLKDVDAVQVHKFSKFQHALAFIHPSRVSIVPHWYKDFKDWSDGRRAAMKNGKSLVARSISFDSFPNLSTTVAPNSGGHQLKDLNHVDPKAIMANERTLLHYAEKALYVSTCSALLFKSGSLQGEMAGLVLVIFTIGFLVHAMVEYGARHRRINARGAVVKTADLGLGWARGPLFVTVLVVCVLVAALLGMSRKKS